MDSDLRYLVEHDSDQRRIQREFDDRHIRYGWNNKTKEWQAWYRPENSLPYMITTCRNVSHGIRLLRGRQRNDQRRAVDLLAQIDENNARIHDNMVGDANAEIASQLRSVASGRQIFMT